MTDCIIELYTEELPPLSIERASIFFGEKLSEALKAKGFDHKDHVVYATPHRLAVKFCELVESTPEQKMMRKGPALDRAFKDGKPTPAAMGFAKSNNTTVEQLEQQEFDGVVHLCASVTKAGELIDDALTTALAEVIRALPFGKTMRWNNHSAEFARPVHGLLAMYGARTLKCSWEHITATNKTKGHRVHHSDLVELKEASNYEQMLDGLGVIASYDKRRALIKQQCTELAATLGAKPIIDEDLLTEVTGIVEHPYGLIGEFKEEFLQLPPEALIEVMQSHQRYFPIHKNGKLLNKFIITSHFASKDANEVIAGNAKVISARFSDAKFFYEQDLAVSMDERIELLKNAMFVKELGSVYDKAKRCASMLAPLNIPNSERAAMLMKADQTTKMIFEFPELSGIMGRYYAEAAGEDARVAIAVYEHMLPRFADDELPHSELGKALAIADRVDTLVGLFKLNRIPTGSKDPFALRRAALGIIKICIEAPYDTDLATFIDASAKEHVADNQVKASLNEFIFDRYRAYFADRGIGALWVDAVIQKGITSPLDVKYRLDALLEFSKHKSFATLVQANKRVKNLLKNKKSERTTLLSDNSGNVDLDITILSQLLRESAEEKLYDAIRETQNKIECQIKESDYKAIFGELAKLDKPVNDFFESVHIMSDDNKLKQNRLGLLEKLRELFLNVADLAVLQGEVE